MPSKPASLRSVETIGHNGCSKALSVVASTESRMSGSWPIFPWTRPCSRNGERQDTWKIATSTQQRKGHERRGICSPVIANMALDGLERLLAAHFPKKGSPQKRATVNLIRCAEDFCITGASKELLEQEVKPLVEQFLAERGLQRSPEKTVITHIEQGFDFLGQTVRKYHKGKEA